MEENELALLELMIGGAMVGGEAAKNYQTHSSKDMKRKRRERKRTQGKGRERNETERKEKGREGKEGMKRRQRSGKERREWKNETRREEKSGKKKAREKEEKKRKGRKRRSERDLFRTRSSSWNWIRVWLDQSGCGGTSLRRWLPIVFAWASAKYLRQTGISYSHEKKRGIGSEEREVEKRRKESRRE